MILGFFGYTHKPFNEFQSQSICCERVGRVYSLGNDLSQAKPRLGLGTYSPTRLRLPPSVSEIFGGPTSWPPGSDAPARHKRLVRSSIRCDAVVPCAETVAIREDPYARCLGP